MHRLVRSTDEAAKLLDFRVEPFLIETQLQNVRKFKLGFVVRTRIN
jgi:hypothetical protein